MYDMANLPYISWLIAYEIIKEFESNGRPKKIIPILTKLIIIRPVFYTVHSFFEH